LFKQKTRRNGEKKFIMGFCKSGCCMCGEPLSSYGEEQINGKSEKVCVTCSNWKSRFLNYEKSKGTPNDFKVGDKIYAEYCKEWLPAVIYSIEVVKTSKGDMCHYLCYYEHHYCFDDKKEMIEDFSWFKEIKPRTEQAVLIDINKDYDTINRKSREEPRKLGETKIIQLPENILTWIELDKKKQNVLFEPEPKDYSKMNTLEKMEAHNKRLTKKQVEEVELSDEEFEDVDEENSCLAEEESICPVILCEEDENGEIKEVSDNNPNKTEVETCYLNVYTSGNLVTGEELQENYAHEMPKGVLGSSWGSGNELKGTNEELLKHFLDFFEENAKKPYADIKDNPFTQTLRVTNCAINFSVEAKNLLTKREFNFKKLEEETNKIKATQLEASPEILMKAKTFDLMEIAMSKLSNECSAIKGYFEFFLNRRNTSKDYHLSKIKELGIDTSDLNKLKELYESKAKIYKIYYNKVHMDRWGKPADMEYCYV
jgi:hypothetical protein